MAIDRIPGVGPQNSDVASAVAAVVPTNSSIAAAVPTNTSIANAVAAAVPTNTSIANAVAAAVPTNSNIANAVAAAVPTNASITNIVQSFSAGPTTFNRVAILTNSQTWNHPDGASANNARRVQVLVVGGGGGGGGGTAAGTSTPLTGGAGGGSGYAKFAQTYVTGSVSVVVGAAGNGGTGQSISRDDAINVYGSNSGALFGNDGNNGGYSAFGNITAGGGFYGSGTLDPSGGFTFGSFNGTTYSNSNFFSWSRAAENLTSRMWASRGGSGGGYATGKSYGSSTMGNAGNYSNAGNIQPNSTNISYPRNFSVAFPFGGAFGNHAGQSRLDANTSTPPLVFDDIYGTSSPSSPSTLANTFNNTNTHPAFFGWGINTQSQISVVSSTSNANTWNSVYVQNVRDVQSFDSQFQSGGGSAGWGSGDVTSATGIPGGLGLLGSGGSGGTSQTAAQNSSATRSAGNGGAATGYGGGGGGGSSAMSNNPSTYCTSGNGGAGAPGVVVVYY